MSLFFTHINLLIKWYASLILGVFFRTGFLNFFFCNIGRLRIFQIFKFISFHIFTFSSKQSETKPYLQYCLEISLAKYSISSLANSTFHKTLDHKQNVARFFITLKQELPFLHYPIRCFSFPSNNSSEWPLPSMFYQYSVHDYLCVL